MAQRTWSTSKFNKKPNIILFGGFHKQSKELNKKALAWIKSSQVSPEDYQKYWQFNVFLRILYASITSIINYKMKK